MIYELFRWIGLITGYPLQLLFFKRKTYYEDKSEQGRRVRGGALVISNHYSPLDYIMNMFLFPFRKLHVVMSEVTFRGRKKKLFKFLTKFHGGICSDRDIMGMKFIDDSVEVIENGGLVQIFPEAHITTDGDMHEFKTSYLMIALRSDAPIIPVIIDGSYGFFKRSHVIIGKKIYLSDYCTSLNPTKEEILALNDIVYKKSLALKEELDLKIKRKDKK
jgi:1-acyl-sn-glycerol-3-phosphate acyltransferase